jgi:ornithine cyclodeaminase
MRILRAGDVRASCDMRAAIALMRTAFAQLATGEAAVPERVSLALPGERAVALCMPATLGAGAQVAVKVVGVVPGNAARGLPTVPATVLLLDGATGLPLALMDGTYLTALRTGAAVGLATDLLARRDARILALFGAGGQAPAQAEAICRVRPIARLWIVNRTRARAEALAERLAGAAEWAPPDLRAAGPEEARRAVEEADVIATATSAPAPLFPGAWVRPGTHVNAVGAFTPATRELDGALLRRARVVVDQRAAAMAEAGDLLLALAEGALAPDAVAELGEVVLGRRPGRDDDAQITCFKSVGVAAQDVAVAYHAYHEAVRLGLGLELDLRDAAG